MDPAEFEQMRQIEALKKQIMSQILNKEAYERLGRVRITDANLANQAELYLLQLYQAGKIQDQINDEQMKEILSALSTKKGFKITRK
jgi:DNA-binding TFAR19-related protein (PDSD5 family)